MFNVGGPEIMVILLLALIVLGPGRLPDAARQLGRMRAEIRKLSTGFQDEIRTAFDEDNSTAVRSGGDAVEPPVAVEPPATADPDQVSPTPTPARPARRRSEPLRADRSSTRSNGS